LTIDEIKGGPTGQKRMTGENLQRRGTSNPMLAQKLNVKLLIMMLIMITMLHLEIVIQIVLHMHVSKPVKVV